MSKVVVTNSLTLDGVMQAPACPDEDLRGGSDPYASVINDVQKYVASATLQEPLALTPRRITT